MDALFQQLGDLVSGIWADPRVGIAARIFAGYWIAVWLACALWAFVDMRRRTGSLAAPYVIAGIVIFATPLLFPLALVLHLVVRPRVLGWERHLSGLREAAFEAQSETRMCPTCGKGLDPAWLVCPQCRTTVAHRCDRCGKTVPIDWAACAWCGASFDVNPRSMATTR